ncbi:DMT family transporter [Microbulbifer sp. OS29]|uniref:DMT family transporter n=1 Tax=Microbulbifer okhotskensis TaxID=2926617 RepID=A0A9X2ES73_9GAMM|nr:DMT family transporter [Microbulbifer okhotskensis]MCO1334776.1 DMT family transporter [Microbulbifer okhotskensis]
MSEATKAISPSKPEKLNRSLWWVHSLMVLTTFFVASSFTVGKLIADSLPANIMMLIRFLMAAGLFAPFIFFKHGSQLPTLKKLTAYALLSIPLVTFFWCMFEALKHTSAINTGALFTTVPAMTAIFALIINGERSSNRKIVGLFLGILGAAWIIFRGNITAAIALDLNQGDWIFLFGAVLLSLYNPLVKRVHSGEPTEVMTFWVIVFGAIWLLLLSLPSLKEIHWQSIPFEIYGGLLYLALFTTLLSFFLLQLGTVKIGPTKVAAYGFLSPVFVLLITLLLGMTKFSISLLPGIILVFSAILFIQAEETIQS